MTRKHFLLLLLVAFALRLPGMFWPLWYDENYTVVVSRLPLDRILQAIMGDVHPPLYYLMTWLLYRLPGLPVWAARLPSLLWSMLGLVAFRHLLAVRGDSPRLQSIALWLLALAPQPIYYASEARMYSWLCLLVMLGYLFVLQRRWLLTWLVVTLLAYTHNYGLFYGTCLGLVALVEHRAEWKRILPAFLGAALVWLPWAIILRSQFESIHGSYWITHISPAQALLMLYEQIWSIMLIDFLSLTVTFAWLLLGLWFIRRELSVLILALIPTGLALAISYIQPILLFRALIGSAPFLYIACAAVLERAWPSRANLRPALLAAIALVPLFVMSYGNLFQNKYRFNFSETLAIIERDRQPGDVIATSSDSIIDLLPYTDLPIYYVPSCQDNRGALTDQTRRAIGYQYRAWDDLPPGRVWLITWHTPLMFQCSLNDDARRANGQAPIFSNNPAYLSNTHLYLITKD